MHLFLTNPQAVTKCNVCDIGRYSIKERLLQGRGEHLNSKGGEGADTEECLPPIVQRTTALKHWNLSSGLGAWWNQGRNVTFNNFRKISAADWKRSSSTHKRIKHHYLSWSAEFSYLSSSRSSEEMPSLRSKLQILDRAVADDSTREEHVKAYE